ncbi:fibronectin type III domain-containing protein [Winogradskyella rapida]|uniref:Fibronectin type III domain-containing protein n=1 Tax=Winogradskyella rapida TaxID=549701 RepID=A0ABW3KUN0_9FLAO
MIRKIGLLSLLFVLLSACSNDDADQLIAACDTPTDVTATAISHHSITITWSANDASSSYRVEYGLSGFTVGNGTALLTTNPTVLIDQLEPNTSYDVYVQNLCDTNNESLRTALYNLSTTSAPVIPEFKPQLSELNLFLGPLNSLSISPQAIPYELSTPLFTDYAHKQRLIALPAGTTMAFNGDGLPIFPDQTVIAKTFFYNNDERDLSLGQHIIETRILIKSNGTWQTGNYIWNEEQTDATLDSEGSTLPVSWIDMEGTPQTANYKIPSNTDCFTCHANANTVKPIGPKLRSLNFDINGTNQLEQWISNQQLSGVSSSASVRSLPKWDDSSVSLEERARAYMDINCAHCHIPGGHCEDLSTLNLAYETPLEDSDIVEQAFLIDYRMSFYLDGISMPLIGTSMQHTEGVDLIQSYLNTLD